MFVNKEELLRLINIWRGISLRLQNQSGATSSFFAGEINAYENMQVWLNGVETIEGPKRKRKAKANG